MNILYYEADKIKYDQLCDIAKFVNNELGETIFLPNSTHLLINANACELIQVMEQLCDALEKSRKSVQKNTNTQKKSALLRLIKE